MSAQMKFNPNQKSPVSDFWNSLGNNISGFVNSTPVQQMVNSPVGLALQGKFDKVIPALQNEFSANPTVAGKPYKPQVVFGGEMQDVSGLPAGGYIGKNVEPPPTQATHYTLQNIKGTNKTTGLPKGGSLEPVSNNPEAQYAQNPPEYPKVEANPNQMAGQVKTEPIAPKRPNVPEQPGLTPAQQKAFEKSGLDKYQLGPEYGDKRVPLENQDKSVMANVLDAQSPQDALAKLPAAEQHVWNQVEAKAAQIPTVNINNDVIPHIESRLNDLVKKGLITEEQAHMALLQEKVVLGSKAADPLSPDTISGQGLIDLKTGANANAPKSIPMNVASPQPYILKAVSDGYGDAIGNLNPDIKYLYNQYSSLKRIGDMSTSFRNTAGKAPTIFDQFKRNPIIGGAIAMGAAGPAIAGAKAALPVIENVGGGVLGFAKAGIGNLDQLFNGKDYANSNKVDSVPVHNTPSSIPQDVNGNYTLPPNPGVSPLIPGTPQYTRAQNALPGNSRQFMANAPQYMGSANQVNNDIKSGMPLDLMSRFKSSQEVQAYLSNPNSPYAKQLANIADLDAKFKAAYTQINGVAPGENQFINPGDSKEQFMEKYNEMVSFIYNNYSQFQVPYLQTTESPQNLQVQQPGGTQGTVKYSPSNNNMSGINDNISQVAPPSLPAMPPAFPQ